MIRCQIMAQAGLRITRATRGSVKSAVTRLNGGDEVVLLQKAHLSFSFNCPVIVSLSNVLDSILFVKKIKDKRREDHTSSPVPTDTAHMYFLAIFQLFPEPRY